MKKITFVALVLLGGIFLTVNVASAASVRPRPQPPIAPPAPDPEPIISAN